MPADLEPVAARALVVGVMDHPARQPQNLLLERGETLVRPVAARRQRLASTGKLKHRLELLLGSPHVNHSCPRLPSTELARDIRVMISVIAAERPMLDLKLRKIGNS